MSSSRRGCEALLRTGFLALVPGLVAAGCTPVDQAQVRICRIALPALESAGVAIALVDTKAMRDGVLITYEAAPPGEAARRRSAGCRFAPGRRDDLVAITTNRGPVSGAALYLLKRYYIDTPEGPAGDPGAR